MARPGDLKDLLSKEVTAVDPVPVPVDAAGFHISFAGNKVVVFRNQCQLPKERPQFRQDL